MTRPGFLNPASDVQTWAEEVVRQMDDKTKISEDNQPDEVQPEPSFLDLEDTEAHDDKAKQQADQAATAKSAPQGVQGSGGDVEETKLD